MKIGEYVMDFSLDDKSWELFYCEEHKGYQIKTVSNILTFKGSGVMNPEEFVEWLKRTNQMEGLIWETTEWENTY